MSEFLAGLSFGTGFVVGVIASGVTAALVAIFVVAPLQGRWPWRSTPTGTAEGQVERPGAKQEGDGTDP